jgi:uncharacterized protein
LEDTRVVLVNGARQCGKSTLLRQIARGDAAEWRDLDLPLVRQAAVADPIGFVDYPGMMVIDEIHRGEGVVDSGPRRLQRPATSR